jgi:hypothetical protein
MYATLAGTNVILERQQRLTEEYVPRADLVLFVLSADRPLSESELAFLKYIRQWRKKVVFVVNKVRRRSVFSPFFIFQQFFPTFFICLHEGNMPAWSQGFVLCAVLALTCGSGALGVRCWCVALNCFDCQADICEVLCFVTYATGGHPLQSTRNVPVFTLRQDLMLQQYTAPSTQSKQAALPDPLCCCSCLICASAG